MLLLKCRLPNFSWEFCTCYVIERDCVCVCVCVCSTSIVVRAQMVRPSASPCAHYSHPVPRVPGELAGQQRAECRVSCSIILAGILFHSSNLQS
jgi:hypothetical protein